MIGVLVGSTVGALVAYTLSDAFFPEPSRAVRADRGFSLMPMVSTTREGGVLGTLVGRF